MRAIPESNLSYPVLIKLGDGSSGSGFYLNGKRFTYLVTAKHVLFDAAGHFHHDEITLISSANSQSDTTQKIVRAHLGELDRKSLIRRHQTADVVTIRYGQRSATSDTSTWDVPAEFEIVQKASSSTSGIPASGLKLFKDVLVSNDILLFGYPSSIGLQDSPQFDYSRPLLRKGIIAGRNHATKSIILDCPSYYGNSGGPVIEIELEQNDLGLNFKYCVCGVLTQFIPYTEIWRNSATNLERLEVMNSGYSVAASMDSVLEIADVN